MAISTNIPESYKLPLVQIYVDGSQAGNLTEDQPALVVGQMLSTGFATPNTPIPVGSLSLAKQMFGEGSIIERMFNVWFQNNTTQNVWALPIVDPPAGVAASGSITITAAPTSSGVLSLYVGSTKISVSAFSTDTPAVFATRLAASINALTILPVTATVDTVNAAKVNLLARHKGDLSNDLPITFNYLGYPGGEQLPAGLALTITPMSDGTGQPDFTTPIANIASKNFVHVALPYSDTGSLEDWDVEYGFGPSGRWNYTRQQYGWLFNAARHDYADALLFGESKNSAVISTMAIEPGVQSTVYEVAAAYAAVSSAALLDDAARPLQTLQFYGILPAPVEGRFSQGENNNLTNNGLAVQGTNANGRMAIIRETLQYQFNSYSQADTAFGLVTILSNLAELLNRMKSAITSKYPRHKLAPNTTRFGAGQKIVTPNIIKGELVSEALQAEYDGLLADSADFIANLVVEIDDLNPNRINVLWPPQLMGQLRQFAVDAQFRLQYPQINN